MATLNVSKEQKDRVIKTLALVQPHFPDLKLSQADVVNLGMTELENKYK